MIMVIVIHTVNKLLIFLDASGIMAKERGAKLYATDER